MDYDKCVGCGACAKACPRNIITMLPFKSQQMLAIRCSNKDFGKDVKAVCKVGCLGCAACQRVSDSIKVTDNIARVDYDKYDPASMEDLLVALEKCPSKSIVFVGKPTEDDLAAVVGEETPGIVQADFKTTVDKTDWRG